MNLFKVEDLEKEVAQQFDEGAYTQEWFCRNTEVITYDKHLDTVLHSVKFAMFNARETFDTLGLVVTYKTNRIQRIAGTKAVCHTDAIICGKKGISVRLYVTPYKEGTLIASNTDEACLFEFLMYRNQTTLYKLLEKRTRVHVELAKNTEDRMRLNMYFLPPIWRHETFPHVSVK